MKLVEAQMWLKESFGVYAAMHELVNEYQSRLEKGGDPPLAPLGDPVDVPVHRASAGIGAEELEILDKEELNG